MRRWRQRVFSAWRRHGFLRFFQLAIYNVWYELRLAWPKARVNGDDFDAMHGTDTASIVEVSSLDIRSPNVRHAIRYQPSSGAIVKEVIESLDIDFSNFTFVDFGSGKGRVLLLAVSYRFKAVVGVELSRDLHDIAMLNIQRALLRPEDSCKISLVCRDVAEFPLPDSDLLCYLYNPFGPAVLVPLAERLWLHSLRHGHRVLVIYVDPKHRDEFKNVGSFRVVRDEPSVLVVAT